MSEKCKAAKQIDRICKKNMINQDRLYTLFMLILKDYWNRRELYRDSYERRVMREGSAAVAGDMRIYLQGIHNENVTDLKTLEEGLELLSGSGILDDIIDKSVAVVVRRFEDVGECLYGPILNMKYGKDGGYTWDSIEELLGISTSYRYARCREAILAVGLVFFTEFYDDCIQYLMDEENKREHSPERRHLVTTAKGVKNIHVTRGSKKYRIDPKTARFNKEPVQERTFTLKMNG